MNKFLKLERNQKIIASLIAILFGFIFAFIILNIAGFLNPRGSDPVGGLLTIITGGLRTSGIKGIGTILKFSTPVILTGLSVGFAFKTGLFNIGASGQYIMGGFSAAYVSIKWLFIPVEFRWIVALLIATLIGGIWGLIAGVLKAKRNVNEVISSIMLNYIGMYTVSTLVPLIPDQFNPSRTQVPLAKVPTFGLDKIFGSLTVDFGIIISIAMVFVIYIILEKTTFGYELKACGYNREAARYAGINDERGIMASMFIAGALSGLAGGLVYISSITKVIDQSTVLQSEGFDGISVALLGLSNPFGILFSGIFISMLRNAGVPLSRSGYNEEVVRIMTSTIIYASAFSLIMREKFTAWLVRKDAK